MGKPPKRIFIEVARESGKRGERTFPRKAKLAKIFKKNKKIENHDELLAALEKNNEFDLRKDRLYLWHTQLHKCMYSGEEIPYEDLFDSNLYEVDHIYPRSQKRDRSTDNLVLVKRSVNEERNDKYPLPENILKNSKVRELWDLLREVNLISSEKYYRLIRVDPLDNEEKAGFIAQQIFETRHSIKITAELLKRKFGNKSEIIYVKNGTVAAFRREQRISNDSGQQKMMHQCERREKTKQDPLFLKNRDINDFHHAKDAYLNIVVGNVYYILFTRNPASYIKSVNGKYDLNMIFAQEVFRWGEIAWRAKNDISISIVRNVMRKNSIHYTRYAYERSGFGQIIR